MDFDLNIIDDYIKSIEYYNFQDFCDRLLHTLYPKEYTSVRAGGRNGDMKNDGYCYISRIFFQAHATRGESSKRTINKIEKDFKDCIEKWNNIKKFVYLTNDTLLGVVENHVDKLREKHPNISIETWDNKKIVNKIRSLNTNDIEYVINRKLIAEHSILDSEIISAKYLITKEYPLIKEIANGNLENFPFENPLLLDNEILSFLQHLTKGQKHRSLIRDLDLDLEKEQYSKLYSKKYPDAITIPKKRKEYQFYYHKRIPSKEDIRINLKSDNIVQHLLNSGVPNHKLSKVTTYFAEGCIATYTFHELYQIRPLYTQFLILKNISNSPIRIKTLKCHISSGVLYENQITNKEEKIYLPESIIEPKQNIIITTGLFLSKFEGLSEVNSDNVSSKSISEGMQNLQFGKMEQIKKIDYMGPSLIPTELIFYHKEKEKKCDIHPFSFNQLYWINKVWMCGSCPHLFFIKNGELIYQGEILNVLPNHFHKEKIFVPKDVEKVLIAELEQETTFIQRVWVNNILRGKNIELKEGRMYAIEVNPYDVIELFGKYKLNRLTNSKLPINMKKKLVETFKRNFTQTYPQQTISDS